VLFKGFCHCLTSVNALEQDLKDSEAGEKHQTEIFLLLTLQTFSLIQKRL
jgi:hypothetical protein